MNKNAFTKAWNEINKTELFSPKNNYEYHIEEDEQQKLQKDEQQKFYNKANRRKVWRFRKKVLRICWRMFSWIFFYFALFSAGYMVLAHMPFIDTYLQTGPIYATIEKFWSPGWNFVKKIWERWF